MASMELGVFVVNSSPSPAPPAWEPFRKLALSPDSRLDFPMSAPEPLNVLVIDDDKALAETIAESLERRGHDCTVATSGKAGAAKVEQHEFDVVLTDLRM